MSPPLPFLRSRPPRGIPISVRSAASGDVEAVEKLIDHSPRAYAGLGGALREAIQDDFAVTAWQGDKLAGFATAYRQGPDAAWIHACGLAADVSTAAVGAALLRSIEQRARSTGLSWLAYMDEHGLPWLRHLLKQNGFHRQTRVLGYEAPVQLPPGPGNQEVHLRPAQRPDIPRIARVDRAAFGPLWAYGEQVFSSVLGAVALFVVAESEGEIVGYILCTCHREHRAHVVRLAVHPQFQGQQMGARLLAEAFSTFARQGQRTISLNTQEENYRSQRLYRWFGFRQTTKGVEVLAKQLVGSRTER